MAIQVVGQIGERADGGWIKLLACKDWLLAFKDDHHGDDCKDWIITIPFLMMMMMSMTLILMLTTWTEVGVMGNKMGWQRPLAGVGQSRVT